MRDARLRIYLNDHLALMTGEAALAARCASSNKGTLLGNFLDRVRNEIMAQRSIVSDLIHRTGGSESRMKQSVAWFVEKLGRFKLNDSLMKYSDLSRVVELEALSAMAQERVAMWDTLDAIAGDDERLKGVSFSFFRDQSQEHLDDLSTQRRHAALKAFPPPVRITVRQRSE